MRLLHGEQGFSYYAPACVGATIAVRPRIEGIYDRRTGT
jgi:hypothetical protein